MSEFNFSDIQRWMGIAYDRHVAIQKAIYYDLYFACQHDEAKFNRALKYYEEYLKDKMAWSQNLEAAGE